MKRSGGITASAVLAIIGSVFTILLGGFAILGALLMRTMPNLPTTPAQPVPPVAFLLAESILFLGFGVWGIASAVGLLRLKNWARDVGPEVLRWVDMQLSSRAHPEQAYRACLGILNLAHRHGQERLEAACLQAIPGQRFSYREVKDLLDHLPASPETGAIPPDHDNLRGQTYYH